jgi:hypothetical protein
METNLEDNSITYVERESIDNVWQHLKQTVTLTIKEKKEQYENEQNRLFEEIKLEKSN